MTADLPDDGSPPEPLLDADLVRRVAALGGLDLSAERAAELLPGLAPLIAGDAEVRRLGLEQQRPLAPLWPPDPARDSG